MNNVKLLHIWSAVFSNFSIVRWHWKIKIILAPPRKSWNDAPDIIQILFDQNKKNGKVDDKYRERKEKEQTILADSCC